MREEQDLKELNKASKKQEKKGDKNRIKTEKIIMLASSVMLLSGLTATGIYYKANQTPAENLKIDLSGLEENLDEKANEILEVKESQNPMDYANSDMDYDPEWKEDAGLSSEEIEEIVNSVSGRASKQTHVEDIEQDLTDLFESREEDENVLAESVETEEVLAVDTSSQESQNVSAPAKTYETVDLAFSENSQLAWPIVGTVLMNYSMDATVYYKTLDQYKYQPGMVIGAQEDAAITAAATCQIEEVTNDPVLGNTVLMNLGSGYKILYGQLKNIQVQPGDVLQTGDIVGFVAKPTKYYSLEGTNLYVEVTKDGSPVNPMTLLP